MFYFEVQFQQESKIKIPRHVTVVLGTLIAASNRPNPANSRVKFIVRCSLREEHSVVCDHKFFVLFAILRRVSHPTCPVLCPAPPPCMANLARQLLVLAWDNWSSN